MNQVTFGKWRIAGLAAVMAAAVFAACDTGPKPRAGHPAMDAMDRMRPSLHPVLQGTVAEYVMLLDSLPLKVEGWGVVAELPGTGSGEMPPSVREQLEEMLYKAGAASYTRGTQDIHPEKILRSNLISAVEVHGEIPPMAKRGDSFDLFVNCLPNSQTTSLSGGLLWTSELKVVGMSENGSNDTRPIAMGRGPVFLPGPVEAMAGDPAAAEPGNMRRAVRAGRVIGGGRVGEDRDVRLQLFNASSGTVLAIERAINSRFPGRDKCAAAENDSTITLKVPPEYAENPQEFIEIINHMYLRQEMPGFSEQKARELVDALKDPAAPCKDISLALQALGRSTLPDYIQPQYVNSDPKIRFWCARAGAALQDLGGMVVLQEFAKQDATPFQKEAVAAIAELSRGGETGRATVTLLERLKSKNVADRIQAYEGLVAINSRAVYSRGVGRKFAMDVVLADCPPTIFVTQTGMPRIAMIGPMMMLSPGLVYISKDQALTLSVPDDAGEAAVDKAAPDNAAANVVTASAVGDKPAAATQPAPLRNVVSLYYISPAHERDPVEVKTTVRLADAIARLGWIPDPRTPRDPSMQYIGASYQRIVEMLATLCKDQLIDAVFVLQKAPEPLQTATDIVTGSRPEGPSAPEVSPATRPAESDAPAGTLPALPALGPDAAPTGLPPEALPPAR